jgi:acyl-CoA thioester hydrolase
MTEQPLYRNTEGLLVAETRFRVRYHETDAMGVVHHAAYITWFEEGRSAFTRALGYPYARMEADGVSLAIAEMTARYHMPARYDEEVIVVTCLKEFLSRGLVFTYEVRRAADGLLLVSGSSKQISVDADGRVRRIPDDMRVRIMGSAESSAPR